MNETITIGQILDKIYNGIILKVKVRRESTTLKNNLKIKENQEKW